MVSAFDAWCFDSSRKPGDSGLIRTEFGWHLMYFVSFCEETYLEQLALENLRQEDMKQWLMELSEAAEVVRGSMDGVMLDLILQGS